jgi:hypothetical protein
MQTRMRWVAATLLCMSVLVACGDDDDDDSDGNGKDGGTSDGGSVNGGSGKGASGSGAVDGGGGGSGGAGASVSVPCGSTTCTSSGLISGFLDACCVDEETETCGQSMMGGACMEPAEADPRCPSINAGGFLMLSGCCTEDDQCGVSAGAFSTACTSLKDVGMQMPFLQLLQVTVPAPRACGENPADGGTEDAGP